MGKNAIKPFTIWDLLQPLEFKPISFLFDKIYIKSDNLDELKIASKYANETHKEIAKNNLSEIEFLMENGLLETYNYDKNLKVDEIDDTVRSIIIDYLSTSPIQEPLSEEVITNMTEEELAEMLRADADFEARLTSINLSRIDNKEYYPLLFGQYSYKSNSKKHDVLRFLLRQFPLPQESTAWEQILDFKSDPDSRSKYLALIHWVNNVASSNRNINEIEDEYNYMYDQYKRHFGLHKIKTNLSTWEMIVVAGIDIITSMQGAPTIIKNLFSISKTSVSLLEEEMKLPGKEIAYIHKAHEVFQQNHSEY